MENHIKKNIPNALTCGNLFSGCIATTYALGGDPKMALIWIIIGAVFDFFDGMSARLLKVSSPIGKELDSLADDVTFGVAPASIVFWQLGVVDYPDFLEPLRGYIPFLAFVIAAFSALRLAKFNIDVRQTTTFIGLPTPANALFWGSLVVYHPAWLESDRLSLLLLVLMIFASSILMVSEIPMFALKFKQWGWKGNEVRYSFMLLSVLLLFGMGLLSAWWLIIVFYFAISLWLDLRKKKAITR